jgi:hypothetical protein
MEVPLTERLRIVVPGPPVAWARAGGHGSRRFTPARVRTYQSWVRECAMVALDGYADEWPIGKDVRYDVRIIVCRDSARRTDLDNHGKHVDCLQGLVFADDSQLATMRITRAAPSKADCCMVIDVLPWTGALPSIGELLDC